MWSPNAKVTDMAELPAGRLNGVWSNELDSQMVIECHLDGTLSGRYQSSVGVEGEEQPLTGYVDTAPENGVAVLGFLVAWPASHSVTVWSGRYDIDEDVITATWLLCGEVDRHNVWRSTLVGCDLFTRGDRSSDQIAPGNGRHVRLQP